MSYEIYLNIPEESSGGHLIASLADEQGISPSQAVERIVDDVAKQRFRRSLYSERDETPVELTARLRAHRKSRSKTPRPPVDSKSAEALIGMLAGNEEFSRAIDEIVSGRAHRYGFSE